jgi:hypothetical protein
MEMEVVKKAIRKLDILGDSLSFVVADSIPGEETILGWLDIVDEVRDSLEGGVERV